MGHLVRNFRVTVLHGNVGADGVPPQADLGRSGQVGAWVLEGGRACEGLKATGSKKRARQDSAGRPQDLSTGLLFSQAGQPPPHLKTVGHTPHVALWEETAFPPGVFGNPERGLQSPKKACGLLPVAVQVGCPHRGCPLWARSGARQELGIPVKWRGPGC